MRNEEQRQRTHDKWEKAVAESVARFAKKKRILAQRQQLVLALRQVGELKDLSVFSLRRRRADLEVGYYESM